MSKKEEFKEFIRNKPELVEYIKNDEMTMQKFYEIYDIYGTDENAWKVYERKSETTNNLNNFKLTDIMKKINVDELQKHINTAQKALGVVEDLTSKGTNTINNAIKGPLTSRPLNKFFEDFYLNILNTANFHLNIS